jgi:hypothetical protein
VKYLPTFYSHPNLDDKASANAATASNLYNENLTYNSSDRTGV